MSLLDLALAYAGYGWPVFPLERQGKQPLGRLASHGLKDATTDAATIRRWWTAEPDANIGIRTGDAFDVADLDSPEAMERFTAACAEHGIDPATFPRARTGGGGRHVLVLPTGFGNRAGVLPGLDWRGRGGYIVAPGSVHPSGEPYVWVAEPNGTGFPPAPPWLLELLQPLERPTPTPAADDRPSQQYIDRALNAEMEDLRTAVEGQRNDTLNRAAFALGQMVGAGWLGRNMAEAELRAAGLRCGLQDPELGRTIRSGLDSGAQEPRQPPPDGWSRAGAGGEIRHGAPTEVIPAKRGEPWPAALADEAYYGLTSQVVWTVDPYTEADPVAVLGQFLALFGVTVGPRPYFEVGATRHSPRIFVGIVGQSAKARKGDSWAPVERLITRANESIADRILGGFGSGEAIVHAVRDSRYGEKDGRQVLLDRGETDKRLMALETELGRLLVSVAREGSTISQIIRDAYDGRPLRNLVKTSPASATNHHIGVIGHSTAGELRGRLSEDQIRNGFANRFIWLAVRRSKLLPSPPGFSGEHIDALVEIIRKRIRDAGMVSRMRRSKAAEKLWTEWYPELSTDGEGTLGVLTERAEAHVLRLSMLYALTDASDIIEPVHLGAARALWEYAERSVGYLWGGTTGDAVADQIVEELGFGPLTRTELMSEVFQRNIQAPTLSKALVMLEQQGRITKERVKTEGRGRPAERWKLTS